MSMTGREYNHESAVKYVFKDWLENAEGDRAMELKEKLCGLSPCPEELLYILYMQSSEMIVEYGVITDMVERLLDTEDAEDTE